MTKLVYLLPFVAGCALFGNTRTDAYIGLRITNNELGEALTKYKQNMLKYAQDEVNISAEAKCKPMTSECRNLIINIVSHKYSDRESTYNMCADIQRETKKLLERADAVCKTNDKLLCDESKLEALAKDGAVKSAFDVISPWIVQGKL